MSIFKVALFIYYIHIYYLHAISSLPFLVVSGLAPGGGVVFADSVPVLAWLASVRLGSYLNYLHSYLIG